MERRVVAPAVVLPLAVSDGAIKRSGEWGLVYFHRI